MTKAYLVAVPKVTNADMFAKATVEMIVKVNVIISFFIFYLSS